MLRLRQVLLLLLALLAFVGGAEATVTGTPPNLSGHTNINNTTVWTDESYTLQGNVSIYAGGNLTLDNTKLVFNSTPTDSHGLFIGKGNATANGGRLIVISGSNITAENVDYNTWVYAEYEYPPSSKTPVIQASDSYFSEIGNDTDDRRGLEMRHTTSETFFDNITIQNSYSGIRLADGGESVSITNCTINNIEASAIYIKSVGAYIYNNNISNMRFGVYAQYTNGLQIIDNTFDAGTRQSGSYVIDILGSPYLWSNMDRNFLIRNNTFENFQRAVVCVNGVRDGIIEDNTAIDGIGVAFGVGGESNVGNSNITIRNNNATNTQEGILVDGQNFIICNNVITNPLCPTGYTAGMRASGYLYNTTISNINIVNVDQISTIGAILENSWNISLTNVTIDDFKYGLKLFNMSDTWFVDLNVSGSTTYSIDFRGLNTDIKFINNMVNISKINFTDTIDLYLPYCYLDIEVVDSSGNPIQDANVTIVNNINGNYPSINITGDNKTSFVTGSNGHTPLPDGNESNSVAILDYLNNSTSISYMAYTVTASKTGYNDNSTPINPDSTWYRPDSNTYQNTTTIILGGWIPSNTSIYFNSSDEIEITTKTDDTNIFSRVPTDSDNNVTSFRLMVKTT